MFDSTESVQSVSGFFAGNSQGLVEILSSLLMSVLKFVKPCLQIFTFFKLSHLSKWQRKRKSLITFNSRIPLRNSREKMSLFTFFHFV